MPPRTRSQTAGRSPAPPSSSGRSKRSRYATPTAFDALQVEGASSSESESESEPEQSQPLATSAEPFDHEDLTPATRRRGTAKTAPASAPVPASESGSATEPESITESLEPTATESTPATAPATESKQAAEVPAERQTGAADAHAATSGNKNGYTHTSTSHGDDDPHHVRASAEAVAEPGHPADDNEPAATASASASSTVNGRSHSSKQQSGSKDQLTAHAHAQASVDTPDEDQQAQKQQDGSGEQLEEEHEEAEEKEVGEQPDPEAQKAEHAVQAKAKKQAESKAWWTKVYQRTLFTFFMIGGFIGLLLLGHPYMILLVMLLATMVYREIVGLFNLVELPTEVDLSEEARADAELRRKDALWNKTLSWYFFVVANYFLYGESLVYYFKHIVYEEVYFVHFAKNHRFLSLMLYVFGFMAFILQLRRDNLKHQFGLFSWVHMTLFLIVVSSHFMVNSILEGLIWFWVPASLIICNDIFAYVCGMLFGRTPLISLSPKKTREGFFGAFVITVVFSYFWGSFFQRFNYMICPAVSLGENAWSKMQCEPNHVFVWHYAPLPQSVAQLATAVLAPLTGGKAITHLPYTLFQLHSLVMASFASLVAPFGGFFASGFKRAFKIKDFGDSIPGHGGLTDRFDCQFLMGLWAYTYYASLIREHHTTVGAVLQVAVTQLRPEEIAELYYDLQHYLKGQGTIKI